MYDFFLHCFPFPYLTSNTLDFILFQCHGFNERSPSNQIVESEFGGHPWHLLLLTFCAIPSQFLVSFISWTSHSIFYFSLSVATALVLHGLLSALAEFILATSNLFSMLHPEHFWFFCLFIFCFYEHIWFSHLLEILHCSSYKEEIL